AMVLREALDCALPVPDEIEVGADRPNIAYQAETLEMLNEHEAQAMARSKPAQAAPLPVPSVSTHRRVRSITDRHIASALPFLLLGPLSRLGYLQTLAATMEAAECL